MSILANKESKIIVQGITGSEGSFHAEQCLKYGGNIVGGVTPGKGGQTAIDGKVPVFNSCKEAREKVAANVSLIFVPPPFAADAIMEAADAGIELIICITEIINAYVIIVFITDFFESFKSIKNYNLSIKCIRFINTG